MRRRGRALLASGLVGVGLPLLAGAPAAAAVLDEQPACDEAVVPSTELTASADVKANPAFARMHIPQAQRISKGKGIRVALIDSGVVANVGVNSSIQTALPGVAADFLSGHGTIVGGLISGPDGVAPESDVISVRVFDRNEADATQGEKAVTSQGIADGIRQVIALHRTQPIHVVAIPLAVAEDDPVLRQAVADLVAMDVVVVAAAGNAQSTDETFKGTQDNDAQVYPADYDGVLAVTAEAPPGGSPIQSVIPNKETDLSAPTYEAISINANGQRCVIDQVATSWATGEVAGVVALLRSHFDGESAVQVVGRLMATTEGSQLAHNPWNGAGVVQAYDALTRALNPKPNGSIKTARPDPSNSTEAPMPPEKVDAFASSRELILWAGLVGGSLVLVAFMLRPLIRRNA